MRADFMGAVVGVSGVPGMVEVARLVIARPRLRECNPIDRADTFRRCAAVAASIGTAAFSSSANTAAQRAKRDDTDLADMPRLRQRQL